MLMISQNLINYFESMKKPYWEGITVYKFRFNKTITIFSIDLSKNIELKLISTK